MVFENNILIASTGKVLVNANSTVVSSVVLGVGDSPSNYTEVTSSEASKIINERDLITRISELPDDPAINLVLSNIIEIGDDL